MEADSTTYDSNSKSAINDICLPFNSSPEYGNLDLYKEFLSDSGKCNLESQIVGKLQSLGLIPKTITCPENRPDCKVVCKSARVIDRVQWVCEGCGKRQPIRWGTFFFKLQCSILQSLQLILAWCEDADINIAAQYFDVKPRVATAIYDKLDLLAITEFEKSKLGGEGTVVLSEIYPDCLNRLSPDTTDQAHVHRILMLADTKQIPTHYKLHVIHDDLKKFKNNLNCEQSLKEEIQQVLSQVVESHSLLVAGNNVPLIEGMVPLQQLTQHCDVDMQHFLSSRIWRQAISLCSASRELCGGAASVASAACAGLVQRYLNAALYRLRHHRAFYPYVLRVIAHRHTDHTDHHTSHIDHHTGNQPNQHPNTQPNKHKNHNMDFQTEHQPDNHSDQHIANQPDHHINEQTDHHMEHQPNHQDHHMDDQTDHHHIEHQSDQHSDHSNHHTDHHLDHLPHDQHVT